MRYGQAQTVGTKTGRAQKKLKNLVGLFLIISVTPLFSLLTGCAGLVSGAKQTSSVASFQINPLTVNFGQVAVGKQGTQVVSITNNGNMGVNLTKITLSDAHFTVTGMTLPMALAVGQSGNLTVTVSPTASGALTGTLTALGDGGSTPVVVNLSATGMSSQPQLSLNHAAISFGSVSMGLKATSNLVLTNAGAADLTVSVVTLSDTDFALSGITTPKTLTSGQSIQGTVTFSPSVTGNYTGNLTITSNDPTTPTATVALTGNGTTAATGQLSANLTNVAFGAVATGSSVQKQIVLTNSGNAAVKISGITTTGAGITSSGVTIPTTLNPSQSATLTASFAPTTVASITGTITITSDAANSPLQIALSGTGAQAGLSISPPSFNFGSVASGQTKSQTFTVTNTGSAALTISKLSATGTGYSVSGMTVPATVAAGGTATFNALFAPTSAGSLIGTVTITSNAPNSPIVLSLSGTGAQAGLSISPSSFNFGSVASGQTKSQTFTVTNTGSAALTISKLSATGTGYSVSGMTVPATVAAGGTATFNALFAPTSAGSLIGTVTITSNAPNSPIVLSLSGTGAQAGLSISPSSFNFGSVASGQTKSQTFTVTNTGSAALTISKLSATGTGYSVSGMTVPATVAAGGTATFNALFAPTSAGSLIGTVTITSNAPNSPTVLSLSGTGAQAGLSISPASFSFGSVIDGQTKSQSITITNTGTATLTIGQLSAAGAGYSVSGLSTPATVAAGGTATFSVLFAPTTAGNLTGTVSITSNAPNSPNVLSLSGTGTAASVTISSNPASVSFTNVSAGSSISKSVTITNSGNSSVTLSQVTVSAKDFKASGITTPLTLAAGQNATMSISFNPTAAENISGNVTVSSSQGSNTVVAVSGSAVQPALTMTPSSASFGNVTVGSPATQTIQLSNGGTGTLTITQVSVAGSGFSAGTLSLPLSLTSGQSANFSLQFSPTSAGAASGTASVISNAPNSPGVITLSGTGIAATQLLSFSSTNLAFGSVNVPSSSTKSVTVTNTGNSSVTISQIQISGTGFSLTGGGVPVTLNSGQTLTFSVVFTPTAAGNDTGTVNVTSNASGSPATITLTGTGAQVTPHYVDLNWVASTSTVSGYNVYRSTSNGSGYSKLNGSLVSGLTYEDTTVQSGASYYYVVTAVDTSNDESVNSNQAAAIIP